MKSSNIIEEERKEKQCYLSSEIIEKGFDTKTFEKLCKNSIKDGKINK